MVPSPRCRLVSPHPPLVTPGSVLSPPGAAGQEEEASRGSRSVAQALSSAAGRGPVSPTSVPAGARLAVLIPSASLMSLICSSLTGAGTCLEALAEALLKSHFNLPGAGTARRPGAAGHRHGASPEGQGEQSIPPTPRIPLGGEERRGEGKVLAQLAAGNPPTRSRASCPSQILRLLPARAAPRRREAPGHRAHPLLALMPSPPRAQNNEKKQKKKKGGREGGERGKGSRFCWACEQRSGGVV